MHIFYHLMLVLWNLAVLAGFLLLLFSELGLVTKVLAILFVPLALMTGYSAWRGLLKRSSSNL